MPEPIHPPFGVTQPRQLDRWLDVNSQNGPLTRTRGYVSLPAFDIPSAGRNYSEIVGVFNYVSSNNFAIKNFRSLTNNGSYSLCIAYADSDLTVHRFMLIRGDSDRNLSFPPTYNGELIRKNFRLEIWDGTDSLNCTSEENTQMFTSILGDLDYRYGQDFAIGGATFLCTSQNVTNEVQIDFAPPQTALEVWLHASSDYMTLDVNDNIQAWQDRSHNAFTFAQGTLANQPKFLSINGSRGYAQFIGQQWLDAGIQNTNYVEVFVLLVPNINGNSDNQIIKMFDGNPDTTTLSTISAQGVYVCNFSAGAGNVTALYDIGPLNDFYYRVNIDTSINGITSSDGRTGIFKNQPGFLNNYTITAPSVFIVGNNIVNNAVGYGIGAVLAYSAHVSDDDRALIYQYLGMIACGGVSYFAPLQFAVCTVLVPNAGKSVPISSTRYLTDEFGNFVIDEFGNRITI